MMRFKCPEAIKGVDHQLLPFRESLAFFQGFVLLAELGELGFDGGDVGFCVLLSAFRNDKLGGC